jgi:hypothetical protein
LHHLIEDLVAKTTIKGLTGSILYFCRNPGLYGNHLRMINYSLQCMMMMIV